MGNFKEIAKLIDHSLLHPAMTDEELIAGCELAKKYNVASVCIKPYAVKLAKNILKGSDVKVGTVIGFPHGNSAIEVKEFEVRQAISDGADEIDMVVNIGKVLSRDFEYVYREISEITTLTRQSNVTLKVIFENDFLNDDSLKIKLCEICSELKVGFVKTSTGYGYKRMPDGSYKTDGATDYDLKLMRKYSAPHVQVKAAGGIRTLKDVLRVKALGVTRIGASATETILNEATDTANAL